MRAECTKFIITGLSKCRHPLSIFSASCVAEFATKTKQIAMNYINYETAIVERFKVKLVGWTYHQIVSPSEIGTVDEIRTLRDALKTGACKWIRLSKRELAAHVKEMS
jgi:hypothetical protein